MVNRDILVRVQVDLDEVEDKIVGFFKVDRKIRNKREAIKRIIREYNQLKNIKK